ncbi:hypothetical protein CR513_19978, partial [Mucuna pruriens]
MLFVPSMMKNLLSVRQFAKDNSIYFEFHASFYLVKSHDTHEVLLKGSVGLDGLYQFPSLLQRLSTTNLQLSLNPSILHNPLIHTIIVPSLSFSTWHSRLDHPSVDAQHICNFPLLNKNINDFCPSCCLGKAHQLPSTISTTVYNKLLELIYSDVWGPHLLTFVDGFTYCVTFFMHALASLGFVSSKSTLQIDWGGEYKAFTNYLTQYEIIHHVICPHTHKRNRVVERKHHHVVELGLTLLAHATLLFKFLDYAFSTNVYLIKRLPTSSIHFAIPYHKLFDQLTYYNFFKIFGCACFSLMHRYNKNKL